MSKFPNIKILDPNYSHKQIIKEGINFIITQHGSVGYEYAYLGIPVINSSLNNPQINYNFNINPKTSKQFIKIILNLKNLKFKIKKSNVAEFYFMRNYYQDKTWFFNDLKKLNRYIKNWDGKYSYRIYEYFVKYTSKKNNLKIIEHNLNNFLKSKDHVISIIHTKKMFNV